MIDAIELTKDYGTVIAVQNVSFHVGRGEVVGFLGLNGAGKTTTLRMLAGSLGPTSGRVVIAGHDIEREPLTARRCLGYLPETAPLYPEMRTDEYLEFRGRLKGLAGRALRHAVGDAAERAGITHMSQTLIAHLSKGYRQRVGLADALLGRPPLLILDEPTAGLDPNQIHEVRELIRQLGDDHTLLLSTHILPEVEATCDRALVIHQGQLVAQGSLEELRSLRAGDEAELHVRGPKEGALEALRKLPNVTQVSAEADGTSEEVWVFRVRLAAAESEGVDRRSGMGESIEECVRVLVDNGWGVQQAQLRQPALDEVFRSLTISPDEEAANTNAEALAQDAGRVGPAQRTKGAPR